MLKIGINENVYLVGAVLNDKATLEISFDQAGGTKAGKPANVFDTLAADEVIETGGTGTTIRIFPPNPPKDGGRTANNKTEEQTREMLINDINRTKAILDHIMKNYLTVEEMKAAGAMGKDFLFRGLEVDPDTFNEKVFEKSFLIAVHENMAKAFITALTPFAGKEDKTFRLLLVRQSKDKHYATFRGRYIEDNPFMESMEIPLEASKVKFTSYELGQGLDKDTPLAKPQDGGAAGGGTDAAPETAAQVFG